MKTTQLAKKVIAGLLAFFLVASYSLTNISGVIAESNLDANTETITTSEVETKSEESGPLKFTALEAGATIALKKEGNPDDISLQTSTDGTTWSAYTVGDYITLSKVNACVYFRATTNNVNFSKDLGNYYIFSMTKKISASGNIMSLVDSTCASKTIPNGYAFARLFKDCTTLTSAPELPATTLAHSCYYEMFYRCSSLLSAPELPAVNLTDYCYWYMFFGCSRLVSVQAVLPATTLKNYCYDSMFRECTSLTSAPNIPATTLGESPCRSMFSDCTSLLTPPKELPATKLTEMCYNAMFLNCTSLTSIIELKPTSVYINSCNSMYYGCTKIKVHERAENEDIANRIVVTTPAEIASEVRYPFAAMFSGTSGAFTAGPSLGKTYVLDPAISLTADANNENPTVGVAESLKYTLTSIGFKIGPTNDTISINYYYDSACEEKITDSPFTHSLSGTTLTLTSKTTTEAGDYYAVLTYDGVDSAPVKLTIETPQYLKFTAQEAGATVALNKNGNPNSISLQISTDGATWSAYNIGDTITLDYVNDFVYFKATTKNATFSDSVNYYYFTMDKKISASGNIMSLLDSTCKSRTLSSNHVFLYLFKDCKTLISAPKLPATKLSDYCYLGMFEGCASLIGAPVLPATTLAKSCYQNMFYYCTSLVSAPDLPATTLKDGCYKYMFMYCTSLVNAPNLLPAETMTDSCYEYMFHGCASLCNAPELPAKTLAKSCYNGMFWGCKSLVNAPTLPATTLTTYCYCGMFNGCENLVNAPALPATTLATGCYSSMFSGCKSLVKAPTLPAETLTEYCYRGMFGGCSSLVNVPALSATTLASHCYADMFYGCSKVKVREKTENENVENKITIVIPSNISGLTDPVTNMFYDTAGSFTGTPVAGKTYVFDLPITLTPDTNNVNPTAGVVGSLKYTLATTGFDTNPTNDTISITYYSDSSCTTTITNAPFTHSLSGSTLTFTSKTTTEAGSYYAKVTFEGVSSDPVKLTVKDTAGEFSLKFTAQEAGATIKLNKSGSPSAISLQISRDGSSWSAYTVGNTITLSKANDYVYFRATTNSATFSKDKSNFYYFSMTKKISASGNVMSLIDKSCKSTTISGNYAFYKLFNDCKTLTSAPTLPATTLTTGCYQSMFGSCIALVSAPVLPATAIAGDCYNSMFYGCTGLTSAPALPATTLKNACYNSMFRNCTGLTSAPELPATALTGWCYNYMFAGCTSLISIPEMKIASMANSSCNSMFEGCTKLKVREKAAGENIENRITIVIPSNLSGLTTPVTNMFKSTGGAFVGTPAAGKTYVLEPSITITPDKNNVNPRYYNYGTLKYTIKFIGFKNTPAIGSAQYSDSACQQRITKDLPFLWGSDGSEEYTFYTNHCPAVGDYYIVFSAEGIKADPIKISVMNYLTFVAFEDGATIKLNKYGNPDSISLQTSTDGKTWSNYNIGDTITLSKAYDFVYFRSTTNDATFSKDKSNYYYFSMTKSVEAYGSVMSLTDDLGKSTTISGNYAFYKLFNDCKTLTRAPQLPATTLTTGCYQSMFGGCTSLVDVPYLPATNLANDCYNSMFYGCTKLVNAPTLSATTLKTACYNSMFRNCTSLVKAPALPATVLTGWCYNYMFAGCTSLTSMPELKITSMANSSCNSMFEGCSKLKVHEKAENEKVDNKITAVIPSGISGLTTPVTNMFTGTAGAFTGTPVAGKTYVLDVTIALVADSNNIYPTSGHVGSLKYAIKTTNYKSNPTTDSISIAYYSDSACKNKLDAGLFTYSVSGTTLTISSKTTTNAGTYYAVVSDGAAKADPVKIIVANYLMFTAQEAGATIKLNKKGSPDTISLQISTDGSTWSTYTIGNTITLSNINDCVYIKATTKNTSFSKGNSNYYYFTMSKKISASGNIMSLLDSSCESKTLPKSYVFNQLFDGCKSLTSAPELPATTLTFSCYRAMFRGCSITTAPTLPATTMKNYCYRYMFSSCTSLVNAPALPATTLADNCYDYMFEGCTSLVNAPTISAKTLAVECCKYMFRNCTSLVTAPVLSATTLAEGCYNSMFIGCTKLVNAPTLSATTLANSCYRYMFAGCTSLVTAPALPAETLKDYCYNSMFSGCTSLVNAPTLAAKVLASDCYNSMFHGCTSLVNAPALPAETLKTACYNSMFRNCTSLVSAPALPATALAAWCYNYMFAGCTALTTIPEMKIASMGNSSCYYMFDGCSKLKVHEKAESENTDNKITIQIPTGISGLSTPLGNMFTGTAGAFTGTPSAGKTYVLDATIAFTADNKNIYPAVGTVGSLKYSIATTNFKTNPTTESITIAFYSDSACKNKINDSIFTYAVSGTTLTLSSLATTKAGDYYAVISDGAARADAIKVTVANYLKFTAQEAGAVVKLNKDGNPNSVSLQISTDGSSWSAYTIGTDITLTNANDFVFFKATTSNDTFNVDNNNYYYFSMSKKVAASGNVMSLIDGTCESKTISKSYTFALLFYYCTKLTTAPELPATTLAMACYKGMFYGCSSLVSAPALPATNLARYCYRYMFGGCTSLVNAPALSATTLKDSCYDYMFEDCTSLVSAPALPATTLKESCYEAMFSGCTSLVNAPALPAKTLANNCYKYMFSGCKSLVNAPALPAETLADYCYQSMFGGCTSLVDAPALPAKTLAQDCYNSMFYGCTSLVNAPALPATTLKIACYNSMFGGCTSLVNAPELPAKSLANYCYNCMFEGCSSLENAPALPAETLAEHCYHSMFRDCTSLVDAPALPAKTLAGDCYNSMFYGCTSLVDAPALPAETLRNACYNSMFRNCTSLVSAPALPAKALASWCYNYMFAGCTELTTIPELAITSLSNASCNSMFEGCTKLKVHEKAETENVTNRITIVIPSGISGYTTPVTNMFTDTTGSFTGTPAEGKTYVLDATLSLTVDKAISPTSGTAGSLTYTIKTTHFKTNPTTDSISITYYSDSTCETPITDDIFTYALTGTTLTISSKATTEAGDYYAIISDGIVCAEPIKITVLNKVSLTVTGTTIKTEKAYNGTKSITVTNNGTLEGVAEGDEVYIDTVIAAFEDAKVGSNKDVVVTYTLKGNDAYKYVVADTTGLKATIKKAELTVRGVKINDKVYDGSKTATVMSSGTLVGLVGGDKLSVKITSAEFVDQNAGNNKDVAVVYMLVGSDEIKANYVIRNEVITDAANITPKEIIVSGTTAEDREYDGTTNVTIKMSDSWKAYICNGDVVEVSVKSQSFTDKNAGENKTVDIVYEITGKNANNYQLVSQETVTATITKKVIGVSGTAVECKDNVVSMDIQITENGTLRGVIAGEDVTLGTVTAYFADDEAKEKRTVTVRYSLQGEDADNYTIAENTIEAEYQLSTQLIIGISLLLLLLLLLLIIIIIIASRKKKKKDK